MGLSVGHNKDGVVDTTEDMNAFVADMFGRGGDHPFSAMEMDLDGNLTDLQKSVDDGDLVAIVDEAAGGIIGYVNRAHSDRIAGLLNYAAAICADDWIDRCARAIDESGVYCGPRPVNTVKRWLKEHDYLDYTPEAAAAEIAILTRGNSQKGET